MELRASRIYLNQLSLLYKHNNVIHTVIATLLFAISLGNMDTQFQICISGSIIPLIIQFC